MNVAGGVILGRFALHPQLEFGWCRLRPCGVFRPKVGARMLGDWSCVWSSSRPGDSVVSVLYIRPMAFGQVWLVAVGPESYTNQSLLFT